MEKQTKITTIILYAIIIFVIIATVDIYFNPKQYINTVKIVRFLDKITSSQNIAPQRLYINVWRQARNEYVDTQMNAQNWNRWRNRYLKNIKTMDDANIAINTMLSSLNDPYTKFLVTDSYIKQKEVLDSKITGIGIMFRQTDEAVTVDYVLDDSPAQKNDILEGDTIISINDQDASKISIDKILLSDDVKKNDDIKIVIKRNDEIIEKKIKKAQIPIKTMKYKITKDNIGIISLATIMGEKAIKDFLNILQATNNTKGIIIDLRNNYGGILSNAIEMANYMLDDEEIVSIEGINNKLQIYASNENLFKKKPIVILVNKNTASAAEILAGTLKDNLDAIIIGENTYGKNSIQQIIPMSNNTGLVITSFKYILPKGEDIHNKGITPNIYYEQDNSYYCGSSKDSMMKKAIEIINRLVENFEEDAII